MQALGLIETKGLVGAIEASDAAVKAADSVVVQVEYTVPAMCTVKLRGEVADVQAAVEAGSAAARRVGEVVSAHVIPRPHEELETLIQHAPEKTMTGPDVLMNSNKDTAAKEASKPKKTSK